MGFEGATLVTDFGPRILKYLREEEISHSYRVTKTFTSSLVRLKEDLPRSIRKYEGTNLHDTAFVWRNKPVRPYGTVIKGYGDKAPYNQDHIGVSLGHCKAFSVCNLDEFLEPLDLDRIPETHRR